MKILVVSDTHGKINTLIQNMEKMGKFDILFHLGDYIEDALKLSKIFDIPMITVRGNGDFLRTDYNFDEVVEVKGKKIFDPWT